MGDVATIHWTDDDPDWRDALIVSSGKPAAEALAAELGDGPRMRAVVTDAAGAVVFDSAVARRRED